MSDRNLEGFYAVWVDGHEWPELFYNDKMAKDRAEHLARDVIGYTVHVCKFESVGTVSYPANRNVSGLMSDHDREQHSTQRGAMGRATN